MKKGGRRSRMEREEGKGRERGVSGGESSNSNSKHMVRM